MNGMGGSKRKVNSLLIGIIGPRLDDHVIICDRITRTHEYVDQSLKYPLSNMSISEIFEKKWVCNTNQDLTVFRILPFKLLSQKIFYNVSFHS